MAVFRLPSRLSRRCSVPGPRGAHPSTGAAPAAAREQPGAEARLRWDPALCAALRRRKCCWERWAWWEVEAFSGLGHSSQGPTSLFLLLFLGSSAHSDSVFCSTTAETAGTSSATLVPVMNSHCHRTQNPSVSVIIVTHYCSSSAPLTPPKALPPLTEPL